MSSLLLMVLSYPKPLGLSSASRTIATLPYVSGAEFLNQMDNLRIIRGLPNVVQSESRIISFFTPITASSRTFISYQNVKERLCRFASRLLRLRGLHPLSHRYARQRKGDELLPRFHQHLVLVKQRALIEHHRTRLCIACLLAAEAILMFVKP